MKNITAILFDLGGVILNIDYQLTISAFEKLGMTNPSLFYSKKAQSSLFDKIELGKIGGPFFLKKLQKYSKNAKYTEVENAWNAMLLDIPQNRLSLIKNLTNTYKIFLLSNTNEIHIKAFREKLGKKKWEAFSSLFDKIYLSHQIGLRKPNKETFELILNQNCLRPNEVFFIDDSYQHIETAKILGITCHHLLEGEDITALFPDIIQ